MEELEAEEEETGAAGATAAASNPEQIPDLADLQASALPAVDLADTLAFMQSRKVAALFWLCVLVTPSLVLSTRPCSLSQCLRVGHAVSS